MIPRCIHRRAQVAIGIMSFWCDFYDSKWIAVENEGLMNNNAEKPKNTELTTGGTSQGNTTATTPAVDNDEDRQKSSSHMLPPGQTMQDNPGKEPTHFGRTQSTTNSQ